MPLTPSRLFDAQRDRSSALADFMTRRAQDQEISVASIACGHARELDKIPDAVRSRIRFWGIDQDAKSADRCRSRLDPALRELASVPQSETTRTFFTSEERVAWLQIDRLA